MFKKETKRRLIVTGQNVGGQIAPGQVVNSQKLLHLCPPTIEQEALRRTLTEQLPGLTVLSAFTVAEAHELLLKHDDIDLLLFLDTAVDISGAAMIAAARGANAAISVAVYGHLSKVDAQRWVNTGCDALIARDMMADRFIAAVDFALAGNRYVSPELIGSPDGDGGCAFLATCGWGHPLLEQLPAGVLLIQGERIIYANKAAAAITAQSIGDLLRMRLGSLICEAHRPFLRERMDLWRQGQPVDPQLVLAIEADGGELRWIMAQQCQMTVASVPTIVSTISNLTPNFGTAPTQQMLAMSPLDLVKLDYVPVIKGMTALGGLGGLSGSEINLPSPLTRRQHQVLEQLASGASNKEIAKQLGISEATAKLHVHRTLRALGAASRTQAALIARPAGLLSA
jgi:DNA-binding NarL/FixJ family response regulator